MKFTEEEIVNKTKYESLKSLYWELRNMILTWDNKIYIDPRGNEESNSYISFKRKKVKKWEKLTVAHFGFFENHIEIGFKEKNVKDPKEIIDKSERVDKQDDSRLFIKNDINAIIGLKKSGAYTGKPNGITLKINENNTGKDRYGFISQNDKEIDIYYIIYLIMQHYINSVNKQC